MAGFLDSPWPRHGDLDGIFFSSWGKTGLVCGWCWCFVRIQKLTNFDKHIKLMQAVQALLAPFQTRPRSQRVEMVGSWIQSTLIDTPILRVLDSLDLVFPSKLRSASCQTWSIFVVHVRLKSGGTVFFNPKIISLFSLFSWSFLAKHQQQNDKTWLGNPRTQRMFFNRTIIVAHIGIFVLPWSWFPKALSSWFENPYIHRALMSKIGVIKETSLLVEKHISFPSFIVPICQYLPGKSIDDWHMIEIYMKSINQNILERWKTVPKSLGLESKRSNLEAEKPGPIQLSSSLRSWGPWPARQPRMKIWGIDQEMVNIMGISWDITWLVVWNMFFSIYWEFHHANWRTHIFQRGWNHQPVTHVYHGNINLSWMMMMMTWFGLKMRDLPHMDMEMMIEQWMEWSSLFSDSLR